MLTITHHHPRINSPAPAFLLFAPDNNDWFQPCGTAFPVRIEDRLLLITAGHCIPEEGGTLIIHNEYAVELKKHHAIIDREFDIAAIVLHDPNILTRFSTPFNIIFKTGSKICGKNTMFQLTGFPASKNKIRKTHKDFKSHGLTLSLDLTEQDAPPCKATYKNEEVFYHTLSRKNILDASLNKTNFLSRFEGLSGSPVIMYSEIDGVSVGRLASVFIEWHKDKNLGVSVKWDYIEAWLKSNMNLIDRYLNDEYSYSITL